MTMQVATPTRVNHPLLEELKAQTRVQHDQIERTPLMARLFAPGYGAAQHRALLLAKLGYYRPLETALRPFAPVIPQFPARLKAAALEQDCREMGIEQCALDALPQCSAVPTIDSDAHALGVMYVLEGSTLGGLVILRQLRSALPEHLKHHFYGGYGQNTMAFWSLFRTALMQFAQAQPAQWNQVIASAQTTFSTLDQWLTHCQQKQDTIECP